MTTDVSIVIAYRDMGCEHRRRAFAWIHRWYSSFGWEIVVDGGTSDATFTRASAINAAIRRATGKMIVQTDPDSFVASPQRLYWAVAMADERAGLVIPHDRYLYLTEQTTAEVYAAAYPDPGPQHCDTYGSNGSGNVTVFSRETWELAGGYDERFGLWGGDDAAFAYACDAIAGPGRRLPGDMVHLYHPRLPQSEPGHPGYTEQFAILAQYRDAAAVSPDAIRHLVASR